MLHKLTAVSSKLSPGLRKAIGNMAWLSGDQIVRLGLGLLVGVWVARYLGPEQFGLFNVAIAWAGLFSAFAKLGLDSISVRNLSRDPSCQNETLGTTFALKIVGSIVTLLLAVGTVSYFIKSPQPGLTVWLVGIVSAATIFQAFESIDFWFQSQVQSKYTVWAKTGSLIVTSLIRITLIQMRAPLIAFACAMVLEAALNAVGQVIVYHSKGYSLKTWQPKLVRAKAMLKDSWPLIISGLVIMIYMRIDQIMLASILGVNGSKAVGIYSASVRISEMWYFVPIAVVNSVFPSIVRAKEISREVYYERVQQLFSLIVLLGYSAAIPVTFFANDIIRLLYGAKYAEAGPALIVLMWSGLFVCLGVAREPWMITEGLTKFAATSTAVGAIVNVVLNYFFIHAGDSINHAITVAGLNTVLAQMVASYLSHAFYSKTRVIFIQQTKAIFLIEIIEILFKKLKFIK